MSFVTILQILGGLAAFAYGLWSGFGRYRQSQEEIDRALREPGRRRKVTRHFTPLDLVARMTGVSTQRDRRNPFRFDDEEETGTKGSGVRVRDRRDSTDRPESEPELSSGRETRS